MKTFTINDIASDRLLAIQLQELLIKLKLLSGSADGKVGPQTIGAIASLLEITKSSELTPELLQLKALPQPKLDLSKGAKSAGQKILPGELRNFAAKIATYMLQKDYWIDELHNNIVYVEGCNPDGTPNADTMNEWNDLRLILCIKNSVPMITHSWKATTEPGRKYTVTPLNPGGAFRIAFGQYKAWAVGRHKDHEALVQVGEITGHRDFNKDGFRTGDRVVKGSDFGVNQHWGGNDATVGGWSAGCLVGQSTEG